MVRICVSSPPEGCYCHAVIAESAEDLWQVYNLIAIGDRVEAVTVRKVSILLSIEQVRQLRLRVVLPVGHAIRFVSGAAGYSYGNGE